MLHHVVEDKQQGPKMDPCGTPDEIEQDDDSSL